MSINTSHTKKMVWIVGVVALAALGGYIAFAVHIGSIRRAVEIQMSELAQEAEREQSLHTTSGLLADLSEERVALDSFFITPGAEVLFIERIEALGATAGAVITVRDVRLENANEAGEGTLMLGLVAQGTWREITHLLALLDTLPFESELTTATLTRSGDVEAGSWTLQTTLEATVRR